MTTITKRNVAAYKMRQKGMIFREIGERLGVGPQRASALVYETMSALNRQKVHPDDVDSLLPGGRAVVLSTRTWNALLSVAMQERLQGEISEEVVKKWVADGVLTPRCVPGYGTLSHAEVLEWLGFTGEAKAALEPRRNLKVERRYIEYLTKRGYRVAPPKPAAGSGE